MPVRTSHPHSDLHDLVILEHGSPKSGKSTFASKLPGYVFIATEAGLNSIPAVRWEAEDGRYVVQSWDELLTATAEVLPDAKGIIIDTLENAVHLCEQWVCKRAGEDYILDGKLGYGKGTAQLINELRRYITKLSSMRKGICLICHSVEQEIDSRTGKRTMLVPALKEKHRPIIEAIADIILYFTTEKVGDEFKRVIYSKPNPSYVAGDRTGKLPDMMEMDADLFVNTITKGDMK